MNNNIIYLCCFQVNHHYNEEKSSAKYIIQRYCYFFLDFELIYDDKSFILTPFYDTATTVSGLGNELWKFEIKIDLLLIISSIHILLTTISILESINDVLIYMFHHNIQQNSLCLSKIYVELS